MLWEVAHSHFHYKAASVEEFILLPWAECFQSGMVALHVGLFCEGRGVHFYKIGALDSVVLGGPRADSFVVQACSESKQLRRRDAHWVCSINL